MRRVDISSGANQVRESNGGNSRRCFSALRGTMSPRAASCGRLCLIVLLALTTLATNGSWSVGGLSVSTLLADDDKPETPVAEKSSEEKPTAENKANDESPAEAKSAEEKPNEAKSGEAKETSNKKDVNYSDKLKAAARQVAKDQAYLLHYRATAGDQLRWKVTHLVTVDTKIRGSEQTAKTRSISSKLWEISNVDEEGNITFVHKVEAVDMWQNVSGRQEVRYNSRSDEPPPREYEAAAKSIGVPLATVTINKFGRVLKRQSDLPQFNPGLGELTIPFPEKEVKIGTRWHVPEEMKIRLEDGRVQKVLTRLSYQLEKVETGVATIQVKTEVLTPIDDPKVHAQLVQRMTNGFVKFDLEAGRLIARQMDLDETVIGFSGADSVMQYLARLSEEVATGAPTNSPSKESSKGPAEATARKPAGPAR